MLNKDTMISEIMEKYESVVNKAAYRNTFEEETMEMLCNLHQRKNPQKRNVLIKVRRAAAAFAVILLLGEGTFIAAKNLGVPELLNDLFDDNISAEKVTQGQYQPQNAVVSNEKMTAQCIGIVGDEETCLLLLELEIRNDVIENFEDFGLDMKTYDDTVDSRSYFGTYCPAVLIESGEKTSRYMIRYEIPEYWAKLSITEKTNLQIEISGLMLGYTDTHCAEYHTLSDMHFSLALDEKFIDAAKKTTVQKTLKTNGQPITIEKVIFSEYKTEIFLHFPADDFQEAKHFWSQLIENDMKFYRNEQLITPDEKNDMIYPGKIVNDPTTDSFDGKGEYGCWLLLPPMDDTADSLEIRYGDSVYKIEV